MKQLLFLPVLLFTLSSSVKKQAISKKEFCGPGLCMTNPMSSTNGFHDYLIMDVTVTPSTGSAWQYSPSLYSGEPDICYEQFGLGTYTVTVKLFTEIANPENNYVGIKVGNTVLQCQQTMYGTRTYTFSGLSLGCTYYTIFIAGQC